MVEELRAVQADIDGRRHFTEPKKQIKDTRTVLEEWLTPKVVVPVELKVSASAAKLDQAAKDGFIEVG